MKKITLFFALTALIASNTKVMAQDAASQGNITVNLIYGSPSLSTLFFKGLFEGVDKFSYLGPAGLAFEYFLSDNISVGLEGTYSSLSIEYSDDLDSYKLQSQRIRVYPKINFHFKTSEKVDPYFSIGGGYKSPTNVRTTNNNNEETTSEKLPSLIPFAFRTAIGTRYYFNNNIGLSGEFGIGGGALFMGGIIFKL